MTDLRLRQDVIDELAFDPRFDGAHIGVAVDRGVVTLTGYVGSYAERAAAVDAARRVRGIRAIADDIEIRLPFQPKTADDQIAKRAADILAWDVHIPRNAIEVVVEDGFVTLTGVVHWRYQKAAAEADIYKLSGVRGVSNRITIRPTVDTMNLKDKIEAALKRYAEVEAGAIRVTVEGGNRVILEGRVDNWRERMAVEDAAWSAPGVIDVDDRLTIG
jgi:hyperosmotically inducible protein